MQRQEPQFAPCRTIEHSDWGLTKHSRVVHFFCGRPALPQVMKHFLAEERQDIVEEPARLLVAKTTVRISDPCAAPAAGGQESHLLFVCQCAEGHLFQVVRALHPAGGLGAAITAGRSRPIRIPMIAIATNSSIRVKPRLLLAVVIMHLQRTRFGKGQILDHSATIVQTRTAVNNRTAAVSTRELRTAFMVPLNCTQTIGDRRRKR